MTVSDATELYLADVNARQIPDPDEQLAWVRRLDQQQRRYNRALVACPGVVVDLLNCYTHLTKSAQVGRVVARYVPAQDSTGPQKSTDLLLDVCMRRLRRLVTGGTGYTPQAGRALLRPFRLRSEFMQELIVAVRESGAERHAEFVHTAQRTVNRIGEITGHLVQANQRLVAMLARQYRSGPLPFMDLVQEGNLGLLRAIERFDPDHGTRLSTYALWWIRRAMIYAIARQGRDVRPSVAQYWEARQVARTLERLEREQGRRASHRQVAQRLGTSVEALHKSLGALLPPLALDAPIEAAEGISRIEALVARSEKEPETIVVGDDLRRAVSELLKHLPERHATILRMRFGIGLHDDCTLEQIAQQQGVTRERIRQLEVQALNALRALDAAWVLRACLN